MYSIRFRYKGEPHFLYVEINELRHSLNVEINPRLTNEILAGELERVIMPALQSELYTIIEPATQMEIIDKIRAVLYKEMETNKYLRNTIELY